MKEMNYSRPTAYVDGSFNPEIGKYAFGLVLIHPNGQIEEKCGSGDTPEAVLQRNVSGEMIASMLAVKWASVNGYMSLDIYYDYTGIECWATGAWKAKNDLTKKYRDFMQKAMKTFDIRFFKVEAHTNVELNEMADKLAKKGLTLPVGLPDITKQNIDQ